MRGERARAVQARLRAGRAGRETFCNSTLCLGTFSEQAQSSNRFRQVQTSAGPKHAFSHKLPEF
jgi:hypothetical protein